MHESPNTATVEASAFLVPLEIYLEAFAEHDPVRRGELLARCLTGHAEIWGPKRVFAGYTAISEKIAGFHKNWPDCRLVLATGINTFGNVARLGSAIVGPDGSLSATGQSIIELAEDGRICRVIPFWEALPPSPILGRSIWLCRLRVKRRMRPNISLNPDASPAALTRRPLGAG